MLAYFSSLREATSSAAAPASRADPVTWDSARGRVTVTSQHKDLPLCHGTSASVLLLLLLMIYIIIIIINYCVLRWNVGLHQLNASFENLRFVCCLFHRVETGVRVECCDTECFKCGFVGLQLWLQQRHFLHPAVAQ